MLSSTSPKAKLFGEIFPNNLNFHNSDISLPAFLFKTKLKLHNIPMAPRVIQKVITNLDTSKICGPDCIPEVVLKNCEL